MTKFIKIFFKNDSEKVVFQQMKDRSYLDFLELENGKYGNPLTHFMWESSHMGFFLIIKNRLALPTAFKNDSMRDLRYYDLDEADEMIFVYQGNLKIIEDNSDDVDDIKKRNQLFLDEKSVGWFNPSCLDFSLDEVNILAD